MKREVAAERCRFFRGVCPILNRAKEYCVQWPTTGRVICPTDDTAFLRDLSVAVMQDAVPTRGLRM